jgi:hypothetical protein
MFDICYAHTVMVTKLALLASGGDVGLVCQWSKYVQHINCKRGVYGEHMFTAERKCLPKTARLRAGMTMVVVAVQHMFSIIPAS